MPVSGAPGLKDESLVEEDIIDDEYFSYYSYSFPIGSQMRQNFSTR